MCLPRSSNTKNPLSVIRGLGELGKLTADNLEQTGYFDKVIKQADKMNNMVLELLNIFKPEDHVVKSVVPIIEDVLNTYEHTCKLKSIALSLLMNGDAVIMVSEKLFKRALENIIMNSIQNIKENGFIKVMTQLSGGSIEIIIEDNAGGIPEDIRDNLFEPFLFRRNGGTGLGLFMAYHTIVNTHKGKIWFETNTGRGTAFFISLPVLEAH